MIHYPTPAVRAFLTVLVCAVLASSACKKTPTTPTNLNIPFSATDILVGAGAQTVTGATLVTHYNAYLYDPRVADTQKGQLFDSTLITNVPFFFVLGAHTTIPGFELGVEGMRVGGVRRLEIPPELGYGPSGAGPVPGNATLIFDVELVDVLLPATTTQ